MSGLSKNKERLLFRGCKRGGRVTIRMAENLYSSDTQAESALKSLVFEGYLERDKSVAAGAFRIVRLPPDVKQRFKEWKDRSERSEP